jgi:hypothetical protein
MQEMIELNCGENPKRWLRQRCLALVVYLVIAARCYNAVGSQQSEQQVRAPTDTIPEPQSCEQRLVGTDFSVNEIFAGPTVMPRLDRRTTPNEWRFRTRIRKGAAEGPNFAGHYTVMTWGCGTECQMHTILDAKTGRFVKFGYGSSIGLRHSVKSRLLVVNPNENALVESSPFLPGTLRHYSLFERTYVEIKDGQFHELCKENAAMGIRPNR